MRRTLRISLVALIILTCLLGVGIWQAANPTIDLLVLPGAQHLRVAQNHVGQQVIMYQVAQANWRALLDQRLRERHWSSAADRASGICVPGRPNAVLMRMVAANGPQGRQWTRQRLPGQTWRLVGPTFA